MSLLSTIDTPADLRRLSKEQLRELPAELRQFIISTLAIHPGHLASSLGTVELAVALHYVFNTPEDKLVWDVGHQAYAHKILTGRREAFPTIRTYGGLSGFPRRDESPYDSFGTGHSSTSISAVLGMAMASKLQGNTQRQHIAVIGDGSMTGGEAFEALNNAGTSKANILVILNDNGISIDKAVGGLDHHLIRITASRRYNDFKERVWMHYDKKADTTFRRVQRKMLQRLTFLSKTLFMQEHNLFESLGFRYFGPVDGNNLDELVDILQKLRNLKGPRVLHIITKKGKGLSAAEDNPVTYHAPGLFDANTGTRVKSSSEGKPIKYQDVFGHTLVELAEQNPAIVGITPAMPTGCSMTYLMDAMPQRAFDVGIAEQHSVTFAAGLAAQGMLPFCNIYSSFMQRAYDQVLHDVALQRLPVVLCLDRAGLVGDDGATHHGVFDLACLRPIPNLTICSPMDDHELRHMMYTAQLPGQGAVVIRYPRGLGVFPEWKCPFEKLTVGKGRLLHQGTDVAILSLGPIGNEVPQAIETLAAQGISVAHYDMRYLKPLDTEILDTIAAARFRRVITIEDGVAAGGFGSAVLEYFASKHQPVDVRILGIPDRFISHGPVPQLYRDCHIDTAALIAAATED